MVEKKRWLRIMVPAVLMAGALVYLFWSGMQGSMIYYMTLEELEARGAERVGEGVRLAGWVREDSVRGSALDGGITFTITDGSRNVPVSYDGQIPDTFQEGSEVIVEGVYRGRPVFEAATLLAKCPSKYEAQDPAAATGRGKQAF